MSTAQVLQPTLTHRAPTQQQTAGLALLALATKAIGDTPRLRAVLFTCSVFGGALFYGDAVLTPAISILSAVEGLEVGTDNFKPYIVPICTGILIGLFFIQKNGTGVVGRLFGPVCVLWFTALALSGLWSIAKTPEVLAARDPPCLVRSGGTGTGIKLLRARGLADRRSQCNRESVLSCVPAVGALSDGGARYGRHGHRLAGDHFRRVLDDAAGDSTRLPAADDRGAHLLESRGPDLCAHCQLGSVGRGRARGRAREKIVISGTPRGLISQLRSRLFVAMARNASSATDFFNIPPNRVVELGSRVEI